MSGRSVVLSRKMRFLVSGVFWSTIVNHWRASYYMVCCHLSPQLNVVRPSTSFVVQSSHFVSHNLCNGLNVHQYPPHTLMPRLSYTKAVSVNYILCVCAECEVTQSCIIAILNKLPNLTALNLDLIDLRTDEREVSVHNVQMQCIHVCAVTQPAQHACVHSLVCQMSQEGRGV